MIKWNPHIRLPSPKLRCSREEPTQTSLSWRKLSVTNRFELFSLANKIIWLIDWSCFTGDEIRHRYVSRPHSRITIKAHINTISLLLPWFSFNDALINPLCESNAINMWVSFRKIPQLFLLGFWEIRVCYVLCRSDCRWSLSSIRNVWKGRGFLYSQRLKVSEKLWSHVFVIESFIVSLLWCVLFCCFRLVIHMVLHLFSLSTQSLQRSGKAWW